MRYLLYKTNIEDSELYMTAYKKKFISRAVTSYLKKLFIENRHESNAVNFVIEQKTKGKETLLVVNKKTGVEEVIGKLIYSGNSASIEIKDLDHENLGDYFVFCLN